MSKLYKIPCSWEVYGTIEIEASSLEEAIAIVESDGTQLRNVASSYVGDSFEIDRAIAEDINNE